MTTPSVRARRGRSNPYGSANRTRCQTAGERRETRRTDFEREVHAIARGLIGQPLTQAELDLCASAEAKVCLQRADLDRQDRAFLAAAAAA